jgi:hypothetical protein
MPAEGSRPVRREERTVRVSRLVRSAARLAWLRSLGLEERAAAGVLAAEPAVFSTPMEQLQLREQVVCASTHAHGPVGLDARRR